MTYALKLTSLLFVVSLQAQQIDWVNNVKNKPFMNINVKSYGAKGDGATDDTAAVQAAINVAQSWPKTALAPLEVNFPPGNYKVSQVVIGRSGVKLHADDPYYTVLSASSTVQGSLLICQTTVTACDTSINNVTVEGIGFSSAASADQTTGFAIDVQNAGFVTIKDTAFGQGAHRLWGGIRLLGCIFCDVIHNNFVGSNTLSDQLYAGAFGGRGSSDFRISLNRFADGNANGIHFEGNVAGVHGDENEFYDFNSGWAVYNNSAGVCCYFWHGNDVDTSNGNMGGFYVGAGAGGLNEIIGGAGGGNHAGNAVGGDGVTRQALYVAAGAIAKVVGGTFASTSGPPIVNAGTLRMTGSLIKNNGAPALPVGIELGATIGNSIEACIFDNVITHIHGTGANPYSGSNQSTIGSQTVNHVFVGSDQYNVQKHVVTIGGYGGFWGANGAPILALASNGVANYTATVLGSRLLFSANPATYNDADLLSSQIASFGPNYATLGGVAVYSGTGSPNSTVTASPGAIYLNLSGGAGTTLYVKESGVGTNTGWVGK